MQRIQDRCQLGLENPTKILKSWKTQNWHTFPSSTRFVSMTMVEQFSCQIIRQKSLTVTLFGPKGVFFRIKLERQTRFFRCVNELGQQKEIFTKQPWTKWYSLIQSPYGFLNKNDYLVWRCNTLFSRHMSEERKLNARMKINGGLKKTHLFCGRLPSMKRFSLLLFEKW